MAKSKAERIRVEILNPAPGGHSETSLAHARRYVARGDAELIAGCLRFIHQVQSVATSSYRLAGAPMAVAPLLQDARPGMPVLPPTPEWMRAMGYKVFESTT